MWGGVKRQRIKPKQITKPACLSLSELVSSLLRRKARRQANKDSTSQFYLLMKLTWTLSLDPEPKRFSESPSQTLITLQNLWLLCAKQRLLVTRYGAGTMPRDLRPGDPISGTEKKGSLVRFPLHAFALQGSGESPSLCTNFPPHPTVLPVSLPC